MLCVIAKIDDSSKARLNELCKIVDEFNLPIRYLYGHITLVTYLGQNEMQFIENCKATLSDQKEFSVLYNCIELLKPTPSIVASPKMTQELTSIHERLLSVSPSEMDVWSQKEFWHPHTTLFYHTEADLQTISKRMGESFTHFSAGVSKIEFSKVTDSGYEIIDSITLRG